MPPEPTVPTGPGRAAPGPRAAYGSEARALRAALAAANARETRTAAVIESLLEQLAALGVQPRLAPLWSRPRPPAGRGA